MHDGSPDIGEQSRVVEQMAGLREQGTPPDQWGDQLRRIFAQACWPYLRPCLRVRPLLGREHTKALLFVGVSWPGHITIERVSPWIKELVTPSARYPELEIFADDIQHHAPETHRGATPLG